jgi:hypothetical protein
MSWTASYNNMAKQRYMRWKALIMLVSFTASFTVFCHCETTAATASASASCCQRSCGDKKCGDKKKKDDHGCQGMQAVKLNLQDKQTAIAIHIAAIPVIILPTQTTPSIQLPDRQPIPQTWPDRHSPPDRHSLYQCFLI